MSLSDDVGLQELLEFMNSKAEEIGADDFVVVGSRTKESLTRIANNGIATSNFTDTSRASFSMGLDGRRVQSSLETLSKETAASTMERLVKTTNRVRPDADYASLPEETVDFDDLTDCYDSRLEEAGEVHARIASGAVSEALEAGCKRLSGSVRSIISEVTILASNGREGSYERSGIEVNLRAFLDEKATGHGADVGTSLDQVEHRKLARSAASRAKLSRDPQVVEPGERRVLMSKALVGELANELARAASAYHVEAGLSPLGGNVGEKVASRTFSLSDEPLMPGNPGGRPFDDEAVPTQSTQIVEGGELRGYLHNLTTARRFATESNGHAGWTVPQPWSVVVSKGDMDEESSLEELGDGLWLTNTWYTRYNNYRSGDFSTLPRDAALRVEGGEVTGSVSGARISDNLLDVFRRITSLGDRRRWVATWGYRTPALVPRAIFESVNVTTGF